MVGDADFKVIFNFKPCSPCEMKPSAPETVFPTAPSGSLPPRLFFFFLFFLFPSFCHGGISVALLNRVDDQMKESL